MPLCLALLPALLAPAPLVPIPTGELRPPLPVVQETRPIRVAAFRLERHPVTHADFLAFVRARPQWRRDRVKRLFADPAYLRRWSGPLAHPPTQARAPVTEVSYFAARAYCRWRGRRLPTVAEWEYAAAGVDDAAIIEWARRPTPERLPPVEGAAPNRFGVHDLHGLVWEWTADFNSELVITELGGDASLTRNLFCGDHGETPPGPGEYGAFMRIALRGSLEASHALANLGFRCAAGR